MMFLCRHGAHVDNVLTEAGKKEILRSAEAVGATIFASLVTIGRNRIILVSSPQPRAIESAGIYDDVIREYNQNLRITRLDPDPRLDVANGLAAAIKTGKLPAYKPGGDCLPAWGRLTRIECKDIGMESWFNVARRANRAFSDIQEAYPNNIVIAVFHGGVIEPMVDWRRSVVLDDLPSGAVVKIGHDVTFFDPNGKLAPGQWVPAPHH